jgi:glutaredoxin 3
MPKIELFTGALCPFCYGAKKLLKSKGVEFDEIDVTFKPKKRAAMAARAGKTSVPQIWIDDHHVGGYDELCALDQSGQLDGLLAQGE